MFPYVKASLRCTKMEYQPTYLLIETAFSIPKDSYSTRTEGKNTNDNRKRLYRKDRV